MSHEGDGVREVAPNLHTFVENCRRESAEAERELERRKAEDPTFGTYNPILIEEVVPSGKKWWQFWRKRWLRRRY